MEKEGYQLINEQEFLKRIAEGRSFRNNYLKDAVLAKTEADDLIFRNCVFDRVDLTGISWIGLKCVSVKFICCDLCDADLEDSVFENCSFFDPNHPVESRESQSIYPPGGCKFLRPNLHSATFTNCDLSFCIFEGANSFRIIIENYICFLLYFRRQSFGIT